MARRWHIQPRAPPLLRGQGHGRPGRGVWRTGGAMRYRRAIPRHIMRPACRSRVRMQNADGVAVSGPTARLRWYPTQVPTQAATGFMAARPAPVPESSTNAGRPGVPGLAAQPRVPDRFPPARTAGSRGTQTSTPGRRTWSGQTREPNVRRRSTRNRRLDVVAALNQGHQPGRSRRSLPDAESASAENTPVRHQAPR
jgi:hypothetical protein